LVSSDLNLSPVGSPTDNRFFTPVRRATDVNDDDLIHRSRPPSVEGDYGIALVGCGAVAKTHLEAYAGTDIDVRVLCDLEPDRARTLRDEYIPTADVTADHQEAVERADIDVVDATAPPDPRADIVADALSAGKHVLSQKPFATDLDTARRLVDLAEQAAVRLAVNQNGRWAPGAAYLRAAIEAGRIGTVHGLTVERTWDYGRIAGDGIPHRLLFHYAIHWLDLVRCVFPGEADTVRAVTTTSPTQAPDQPVVAGVIVRFESGQATLRFDGDAPHDTVDRTRAVGDIGTVELSGPDPETRTVRLTTENGRAEPTLSGSWNPDGWYGAMTELLSAIERGERPPHSGADNLRTLELVFATIESARTGEAIEPGDATGLPP
jgi:predicted dehydrogenase